MASISPYGLLGGFVGLIVGILDFVILDKLLYPRLRENYELAKTTQSHKLDPNYVMGAIKLACFTVFPILGYIIGSELAKSGL